MTWCSSERVEEVVGDRVDAVHRAEQVAGDRARAVGVAALVDREEQALAHVAGDERATQAEGERLLADPAAAERLDLLRRRRAACGQRDRGVDRVPRFFVVRMDDELGPGRRDRVGEGDAVDQLTDDHRARARGEVPGGVTVGDRGAVDAERERGRTAGRDPGGRDAHDATAALALVVHALAPFL